MPHVYALEADAAFSRCRQRARCASSTFMPCVHACYAADIDDIDYAAAIGVMPS